MKKFVLFFMVLQLSLFASDKVDIKDSVLHDAVRYEDMELLKHLLSTDLDKEGKDEFGNTPLHLAVRSNNLEIVKTLLDNYVDTNVKNSFGDTPIIIAARNANTDIAKELLCSGAKYDTKDLSNISALQYSTQKGNLELAELLTSTPDKLGCNIELSFDVFPKVKTDTICGNVLRGKAQKIVFFIIDTDNTALVESTNAKLFDDGKRWCAKTNAFGSLSGNYEVFVNGFGENKKGKISQKFTSN